MMEITVNIPRRKLELHYNNFESSVLWSLFHQEELPYGPYVPVVVTWMTANDLSIERQPRYGATDEEIIAYLLKKLELTSIEARSAKKVRLRAS